MLDLTGVRAQVCSNDPSCLSPLLFKFMVRQKHIGCFYHQTVACGTQALLTASMGGYFSLTVTQTTTFVHNRDQLSCDWAAACVHVLAKVQRKLKLALSDACDINLLLGD